MTRFKRAISKITLLAFLTSTLSACSSLPGVQGLTDSLSGILPNGHADKGSMTEADSQNASAAAAVFRSVQNGPETIGYTTTQFDQLQSRFREAKSRAASEGAALSRNSFLALSSSLTKLLQYVDRVEAAKGAVRSTPPQRSNAASYLVQPGQQLTLNMEGFCLHEELPAPLQGEKFRMEPISGYFKPEMLGTYHHLIQGHQKSGKSSLKDPQLQTLLWAMRGLKTGTADAQVLNALSPQQKAMVAQADPTGLALLQAQAQAKQSIKGALSNLSGAAGSALKQLNVPAISQLAPTAAPSASSLTTPSGMIRSPELLANPNQLNAAMDAWLGSQAHAPREAPSPYATEFTLLAPDVAARAVGTGPLQGRVEVLNLSGKAFNFQPSAYALNSRSATQGVAPGNWSSTGSTNQVKLQESSKDSSIRDMLINDIAELGTMKSLDALAPHGELGKLAGTMAKQLFSSGVVNTLLQSAPVVGNIINLGMLLTGKNLDGSDMSTTDYIMAGIGVVPVAGNISKILRPAGTKIFAKELAQIDAFYKNNEGVLAAADILTTDTAEYAMDQIPMPDWLSSSSSTAAQQVLRDAQLMMPKTSNYMAQSGIAL
ncbi:TPA: hypothetical protein P9F53_005608 [Pseudomonas aeruginosa]|nr:hypothetical protein [Pseudomonas aeruginosa]